MEKEDYAMLCIDGFEIVDVVRIVKLYHLWYLHCQAQGPRHHSDGVSWLRLDLDRCLVALLFCRANEVSLAFRTLVQMKGFSRFLAGGEWNLSGNLIGSISVTLWSSIQVDLFCLDSDGA